VDGPEILARSLTATRIPDEYGNEWQYHSRSDRHSKIACWVVFFDLLQVSALLRRHVAADKVIFGINHTMSDFKTRRKKNLDLVIARPATGDPARPAPQTLISLAAQYGVALTRQQTALLNALPLARRGPVGSVLVALEAKACMAEHTKARPRLYDELNSSHLTIHASTDQAAAAGLVMVNLADEFVSPDRNRHDLATNSTRVNMTKNIVKAASGVIEKLTEIPRRSRTGEEGFDALGIVVVRCRNDGSEITVAHGSPAPAPTDDFFYDQMIRRLGHIYDTRFANI
jgi:hypothetical protein